MAHAHPELGLTHIDTFVFFLFCFTGDAAAIELAEGRTGGEVACGSVIGVGAVSGNGATAGPGSISGGIPAAEWVCEMMWERLRLFLEIDRRSLANAPNREVLWEQDAWNDLVKSLDLR